MLRDIYAPTDFKSVDADPSLSPEQKLEAIQRAPAIVTPQIIKGVVYDDSFDIKLPYVDGGVFDFGLTNFPNTLYSEHVNVGDSALYGHGIGSRILKAAFRYAVEQSPLITEFHTGWARLGLVNTTVSVLGLENVGVKSGGKTYGWGGDVPLEAVFDDYPHEEGSRYLVQNICARIDRDLAMTFERPVYTIDESLVKNPQC